jgi:Protein of unknown function (DUF2459)
VNVSKNVARRDLIVIGLLGLLSLLVPAANVAQAKVSTVYVARRGWHIDIGIAVAELTPTLTAVAADLPQAHFVFFGFGDRHYLLAKKRNTPVMLGALWPGSGILLVTGIAGSPIAGFGADHVIQLTLQTEQMDALQAFILKSLQTEEGAIKVFRAGPYEDSAYFLAVPKYSALHTCNTWGAEGLKSAGLPVHVKGVIFAGQLWSQARRLQKSQE